MEVVHTYSYWKKSNNGPPDTEGDIFIGSWSVTYVLCGTAIISIILVIGGTYSTEMKTTKSVLSLLIHNVG